MRTHAHRLVAVASEIDPTIPLACCPRLTPHKSWPTRGRAAAAGARIGGCGGRRGGGWAEHSWRWAALYSGAVLALALVALADTCWSDWLVGWGHPVAQRTVAAAPGLEV